MPNTSDKEHEVVSSGRATIGSGRLKLFFRFVLLAGVNCRRFLVWRQAAGASSAETNG
jgi:hypothetical protein